MSRSAEAIQAMADEAGVPVAETAVILREFDRCRPWLAAAIERDTLHSIYEVEAFVVAQRAQLWPGQRSALVTTMHSYPRGRAMDCWLAGGDLDEILTEQRPRIEEHARLHGCVETRIECGRKGWERALASAGYQFAGVILRRGL